MKTPALESKLEHMYFPVNNAKFLGTSFLRNIFERLLLNIFNTGRKEPFSREESHFSPLTTYFHFEIHFQ